MGHCGSMHHFGSHSTVSSSLLQMQVKQLSSSPGGVSGFNPSCFFDIVQNEFNISASTKRVRNFMSGKRVFGGKQEERKKKGKEKDQNH